VNFIQFFSGKCVLEEFCILCWTQVSVFLLVAMSVECCLAVSRPYRPPCLTVRRATAVVVVVWVAGILMAASPINLDRFYGNNGVCMPLHIEDPYASGWQYSTAVFVGVNLTAVVVIAASYSVMCLSVRATRLDIGTDARSGQRRSVVGGPGAMWGSNETETGARGVDGDMGTVWRRLFLIVFTNVLCWIPVVIVKLLAFTSLPISGPFYLLTHSFLFLLIVSLKKCIHCESKNMPLWF